MQYALLIYSQPGAAEALSDQEREANHREYLEIRKLPEVTGGASLHPAETATTVRVQDGRTLVTDGPFADTKEIFAGFYLVEAEDLDAVDRDRGPDPGRPDRRLGRDQARRVLPGSREPALIEQVFRDEWGRVLACLIGYLGDFDLAEEAAAEAFAIAAQRWPSGGMPDNPGAWLVTTARHRAIDRLRRDRVLAAKLPLLAPETSDGRARGRNPHPGRAARARLHVLPPGAGRRGAGGADPPRGGRAGHRGDRAGVPGPGRDDEAPPDPGQVQDQGGRHPVRRPGRRPAARAARRGARRRLPHLQPGIQRPDPGDPQDPGDAELSLAAEAIRLGRVLAALLPAEPEVLGPAGADAAARRAPRGAVRRPGPGPAAGPGPVAVGLAADRRGQGTAGPRPARPRPARRAERPRPVRAAGRDRLASRPRNAWTGRRSPRSTASSPT